MAGHHVPVRCRAGTPGQLADRIPDLAGQLSTDLRRHERADQSDDHQDRSQVLHRALAAVPARRDQPQEDERLPSAALFDTEFEPRA